MSVVSSLLEKFGRAMTVYRSAGGDYNDVGEWEASGLDTSFAIVGSVQPLSGRDRELLPEGVRSDQVVKIYTETALRTDSEDDGTKADQISDLGSRFKVISVEQHGEGVLDHYRVIAQLLRVE